MATTAADSAVRPLRLHRVDRPPGGAKRWLAMLFLFPALFLLGAIVVYPTLDTIVQSFQNDAREFVGFENYQELFRTDRMIRAVKNTAIWVATAPAIITGLGLMFAILTERVRYSTAIKVIVFMPMAISFLSTGVIWRLMYDEDPNVGLLNAGMARATEVVGGAGEYPTAVPSVQDAVRIQDDRAIVSRQTFAPGETALMGLTGIAPDLVPEDAVQAVEPDASGSTLGVVVWRDFKPGGGEPGVIESEEVGLPGVAVEAVDSSGAVAGSAVTEPDGVATIELSEDGSYQVRLASGNFSEGFQGIQWLGASLVTPALIGAFSWMWAGFAVVVIGAGLAALPRDVLEAARVDGATEWQTFRYVTLPLLAPVLGVVFVTLVINVLKIFDIVLVTPPGASQDEANVIALEMWKSSFTGGNFGVGSAVAVVLFLLVVPVMALNIRRFRRED